MRAALVEGGGGKMKACSSRYLISTGKSDCGFLNSNAEMSVVES